MGENGGKLYGENGGKVGGYVGENKGGISALQNSIFLLLMLI